MATGYTCKIGEGVSFNDFVMTCARAMGDGHSFIHDPNCGCHKYGKLRN